MSKTITIVAVALVLLCTAQASAQPKPDDFTGRYLLLTIGGKAPGPVGVSGARVTQLELGRLKVSATYYQLQGAFTMSDGKSIGFNGNMRKGSANQWQGVISSSPNTDAQKSLPFSVTMVFTTQDFNRVFANVAVLRTYIGGGLDFQQTGAAVWVFQKEK